MIDSLKNISTVANPGQAKILVDSILKIKTPTVVELDIINKVDTFYNSAWTKLILFMTVIITVVGVIVPLLINYFQKKSLEVSEAAMKTVIAEEIKKAEATILAKAQIDHNAQIAIIKDQMLVERYRTIARAYHLQANLLEKKAGWTVVAAIQCAYYYIKANEFPEAIVILELYLCDLKSFTVEQYKEAVEYTNFDPQLHGFDEMIQKVNFPGRLSILINDYKKVVTNVCKNKNQS